MLTVTKNTLLNKVLRLEIAISEALTDEQEAELINGREQYNTVNIIYRNIESIKKQLKKL